MTHGPALRLTRIFSLSIVTAAIATLLLGAGGALASPVEQASVSPATAASVGTPTCTDYGCPLGAEWMAAKGADDTDGDGAPFCYWGATCGHNCTNYVAWRQWRLGISNWQTDSRRASGWDELAVTSKAAAQGVTRNHTPSPGAIAQWNGTWGHVAIVEAVSGSTITISQDSYNTTDFTNHGPYSWAQIPASSPDWYIHVPGMSAYVATTIYQTAIYGSAWQNYSTGQSVNPNSPLAAVYLTGSLPHIFSNNIGNLYSTWDGGSGWITSDTGVDLDPGTAISAVLVSGTYPDIFGVVNGYLQHISVVNGAWVSSSTGQYIGNSPLDAVLVDGTIQVMVNKGGYLWQYVKTPTGWYAGNTSQFVGQNSYISAVYMYGGYPQVFSNNNGTMYQTYVAGGWVTQSSGLYIGNSRLAAMNAGGSTALLAGNMNGIHHMIWAGTSSWVTQSSGTAISSSQMDAVLVGGNVQVYGLQ